MSTPDDTARRRPVLLTIAVVIVYLSALGNVAIGVVVMLSRYDVAQPSVLAVTLIGAAIVLLGLLIIAIASGLARGSHLSRVLVTVYVGILAVGHVATIVASDAWDWGAVVQLVAELFVVAVVWLPPGSRHFTRDEPAVSPT
ncbi:hypothetical protein [Microbacterium sp. C7(2022)]|uniref:hypothetical protein n=1 Tax=Microbacterium sp. C7(2022) TaxID=2992759 RepID=UPI00237BA8C7|nr:hypothetical protein [Microbacterium sp. C7(2022)]MDE0546082.1 hypothetical protein [Microbacterium sp. C7(2022)]